jgi:hypothetical protein
MVALSMSFCKSVEVPGEQSIRSSSREATELPGPHPGIRNFLEVDTELEA